MAETLLATEQIEAIRESAWRYDPDITPLLRHIAAQDAEITRLREFLRDCENLTPMGSEFVNNPKRILGWLRDRLDFAHRDSIDTHARLHNAEIEITRLRKIETASHYCAAWEKRDA